MTTRTVAGVYSASNEQVGAFAIKNVLPHRQLKQIDPFLLIHHMGPLDIPKNDGMRIPPHPHAGFEVVTYLLDGSFFHRDSGGHDQVGHAGDINWMTSGSGIVHSEGPADDLKQNGGRVQLLQVWINLPARLKKTAASFRHYNSAGFPVFETDEIWIKTLIGTYAGKTSPIDPQTPMYWHHVKIKAGTSLVLPVPSEFSAALYLMQGNVQVLNENLSAGQLLHFEQNGDQLAFKAVTDSELIVFGGEPLREKVVSYGPFVMNSLEEVQDAIRQYESGKMGALDG